MHCCWCVGSLQCTAAQPRMALECQALARNFRTHMSPGRSSSVWAASLPPSNRCCRTLTLTPPPIPMQLSFTEWIDGSMSVGSSKWSAQPGPSRRSPGRSERKNLCRSDCCLMLWACDRPWAPKRVVVVHPTNGTAVQPCSTATPLSNRCPLVTRRPELSVAGFV